MPLTASCLIATRRSLLERLPDLGDQAKWQEFFDTYWRLIYNFARKSGLTDAEAQDVVQETVLGVVRNITRYDAKAGSFKTWMLQITRWRIVDQLRKRGPVQSPRALRASDPRDTATIERVPDPAAENLNAMWDEEWKRSLFDAALERVKREVSAKHFQVFDCAVRKHWSAGKISAALKVNIAQIYLIKHRLTALLKKEIRALERER